MKKTSITDRIIAYFVLLSISAVGLVGYLSYYKSKQALLERTFDQLTSVKVVKKRQLENYFRDRENDINTYTQLEQIQDLTLYLNNIQVKNNDTAMIFKIPAKYSQAVSFLIKIADYSLYDKSIILCSGSTNNNFIKIDKANINKSISFGKMNDTLLGSIKNEAIKTGKPVIRESVKESDSTQGLYVAAPVKDKGNKIIGVLILDIESNIINSIMLENNPQDGLGNTGESYLIGSDFLMRSKSRFINNSVFKIKVQTYGATNAIEGIEGTSLYRDYRNIDVLGSYGKVNISGLKWYILAEIDLDEAYQPIFNMRNSILLLTIIISLIVFIFSFIFSKRITIPVINLTKATMKIADGSYGEQIEIKSKDEIGTLTSTFNFMSEKLKAQEDELKKERLKRSLASIDSMENERKRLSRELHDGLGQTLISLKLKLENIDVNNPEKTGNIVAEVKKSIDSNINEIRAISNNLMPVVLAEFGIVNAIRGLCRDLNEFSRIDIEFISDFHLEKPDNRTQIYLFRIAQEALNNVVQHSNASKATVGLKTIDNFIELTVSDDGKGFNTNDSVEGNGLDNIRERASLIKGECIINSQINKGTNIIIKIPLSIVQ